MVFDKTKAMRNAERYLAQGKIQSAIGEYKQVVAHDPKDFGTMNMLGDLYIKNLDKGLAVKCYTAVAEHYAKQGFAQKAIAVYNKIGRIEPNSIEISAKLAELYKFKGAVNEARTHYKLVAEHHEKHGQKLEALEIRKQMASLDPSDTSVFRVIAEAYLAEGQNDEAADAYAEAAVRFAKKSMHAEALEVLERALEFKPTDVKILESYLESHVATGTPASAADRILEAADSVPHDRDILELLIKCQIEAGNTAEAEISLVSLVEKEPASYPRLLDLAYTYVGLHDAESAARLTAMAAEHLLLAGQPDGLHALLTEIHTLDPQQLEGLRLRARLAVWQRDESGMHDSLVELARVARIKDSMEDERYALSQLVMIAPQTVEFAERLREINQQNGFDDNDVNESLFDKQFMKAAQAAQEAELETFTVVEPDPEEELYSGATDHVISEFAIVGNDEDLPIVVDEHFTAADTDDAGDKLLREIDSIRFYIDSEYFELAEKAISELRDEFGERPEIVELCGYLKSKQSAGATEVAAVEPSIDPAPAAMPASNGKFENSGSFGISDLRNELGLDEVDAADDSDYDTHYHTAVAYQEMGLLDDAVKEFQEAVALVKANDPSRRFFQCANLLGHCFMQKAMPNLALKWYQRALETQGLSDEEKQGIWYELASAYEADGDLDNAGRYFEQVYAENIDFRDVSQRVKNMTVSR